MLDNPKYMYFQRLSDNGLGPTFQNLGNETKIQLWLCHDVK